MNETSEVVRTGKTKPSISGANVGTLWTSWLRLTALGCILAGFVPYTFSQTVDPPDLPAVPTEWQNSNSPTKASLRGLSVVDDQTVWTCGSGGTVLRTVNSGKQWQVVSPAGFEECDFRCLHAFSADVAVIASSGDRDVILRTTDQGQSWSLVYEADANLREAVFFDGFAFWDSQRGILMSDPVDGIVYLLQTEDGGQRGKRCIPETEC